MKKKQKDNKKQTITREDVLSAFAMLLQETYNYKVGVRTLKLKIKALSQNDAIKNMKVQIKTLQEAIRFIEFVAIPDSLRELGYPIEPVTKLSEQMEQQMISTKTQL